MALAGEISALPRHFEIDAPRAARTHQEQLPPLGKAHQSGFFDLVFHTDPLSHGGITLRDSGYPVLATERCGASVVLFKEWNCCSWLIKNEHRLGVGDRRIVVVQR